MGPLSFLFLSFLFCDSISFQLALFQRNADCVAICGNVSNIIYQIYTACGNLFHWLARCSIINNLGQIFTLFLLSMAEIN